MSADFEPRAYDPLPLGAVEPRGWLRRQLQTQADGLTGHLPECWPDVADNQWLGGDRDGWERGPYYADGLVPLAVLLDDPDLLAEAERWVDAFVEGQDEDGWIGPAEQARDQGYDYDPWPRFVVLKVLRQYHEATGEERVIEAMRSFCRYLSTALDGAELERWGRYRWADLVVSVRWLHERTGDDWLVDLAAKAARQGFDWGDHFDGLGGYTDAYESGDGDGPGDVDLAAHVVNNAMGIKSPAVRDGLPGSAGDGGDADRGIETLEKFHGQATGVFSGDELYAGKHPSRGTELCAVVEYMYSLEVLASLRGGARYGDRLERIAYNALPAAFTPDMWGHQYDQQANQVLCNVAEKDWYNGPDANVFGLAPNFGCCTANFHQGWPKFAARLWLRDCADRTGRDGPREDSDADELAVVAYAPSAVTTQLDGREVTVVEETDYPFEDAVSFTVETDGPATFGLALRIPSWVDEMTLETPDGQTRIDADERDADESDTDERDARYHTVERTWRDGDAVEVTFETPVRAERRYHGAVALHRGPLTFALPIDAEWKQIGGERPHADWELYPDEPWNYGLELDGDLDEAVSVSVDDPGETPFSPDGAPVEAEVSGRLVREWGLDDENAWAGTVPNGVVRTAEPAETLAMIPYGCTNLRVTEFPRVE